VARIAPVPHRPVPKPSPARPATACGAAFPNVQQLLKDYGSHITFYFRNFPLTQLHPNAMVGAEAAEAAALQNKFWPMHDLLYTKQTEWADLGDPSTKFDDYAQQLGLNVSQFDSDRQSNAVKQTVEQDMADGNALGINATPTFYFNGTQFTGGYDYASLRDEINSLLNK
jgi:protein-disulfide isomerase